MLLPEWNATTIIIYSAFTLLVLSMGPGDYWGSMEMKYSKFGPKKGIPSKIGMFFLYFVPVIVGIIAALPYLTHPNLVQAIVLGALLAHFAKRCFEVLFVHKYSGNADLFTSLMIMSFYSIVSGGISFLNRTPLEAPNGLFWAGVVLFVSGEILNFIHHKLLAGMRKNSLDYVIPQGGLFNYVVCPHYLFEIITWVGVAFISQHLFAWLALVGMAGYLFARSIKTLKWYRQKFADFPKDRKAIVPFVV